MYEMHLALFLKAGCDKDLLFNIDRKKQRKRGCFACREMGHFRDNCPTMVEPKKGGEKARR
jgi:hypothetical protein